MNIEEWMPIYNRIIDDFGYSAEDDKRSAELLSILRGSDSLEPLRFFEGKVVEILGPFAVESQFDTNIVAGSALNKALDMGCAPSLLVTDLDGDTRLQMDYNLKGVPTVIHAHGDNIDMIKEWAPRFKGHVVSTCQCKPPEGTFNFGGFTDGDRAVFIADHFNAKEILLNGWDFDNPITSSGNKVEKRKKLEWAKRLIYMVDTPVSMYP